MTDIARILDVSKPTVCFHLRNLRVSPRAEFAHRHNWRVIAECYESGTSMRECQQRFGFSRAAWYAAVDRGIITPRSRREPLEEILVDGRPGNRSHIKWRLLDAGLKEKRCEE